ncbi:MAG: hypothetical protein PHV20_04340 [Bacteroidales bacterium]|nr:hypothetical protein [Bacteroidales bacterium]
MKRITYIFIFLAMVFRLSATDYYCDPQKGRISNDGTIEHPWKSLQEVFEQKKSFVGGDNIYLLSGNHGSVKIVGENESYVTIKPAENQLPILQSLSIGEEALASRWRINGVTIEGTQSGRLVDVSKQSMLIQIMYCSVQSIANSDVWNSENWMKNAQNGFVIDGKRHKIQFNRIKNVRTGIINRSEQTQFAYNSVNFFTESAIQTAGNDCVFEHNLLKNAVVLGNYSNSAFVFLNRNGEKKGTPNIIKNNTLRGNIIYDYTNYKRKFIGAMMGIVSFDNILDMCTFENNLVVTDHWHGITLFNVNNSSIVNNTVVDPFLKTIYPEEKRKDFMQPMGPARIWIENSIPEVKGNRVCNNLVTDTKFKGEIGLIDNNAVVGSTYEDLDETFYNWEFLDFRLKANAMFVNTSLVGVTPDLDAENARRKVDNMANVGAFEFSKSAITERNVQLMGQNSDVELRSNGQKDWNGQKSIRIGGVGDTYNGNAIIPFILPAKTNNLKITNATFSLNVEDVQNAPLCNVDLYGLLPRDGNEITLADYYEGESGKSFTARLIQPALFGGSTSKGKKHTTQMGNFNLADFMNSLYDAGYKAGDHFFLRLSHSRANIAKYSRWQISSANAEKVDLRPQMNLQLAQVEQKGIETTQKPTVYLYPSPSHLGEYQISIANNKENKPLKIVIKKADGTNCYEYVSNALVEVRMNNQYKLASGYYLASYSFGEEAEELISFNIW